MIYTPLTKKAMVLAYHAHHGQVDKSGVPYIFHPIHLAEQAGDEFTCCAALLHDVMEDTPVTLQELEKEFPPEVTQALQLLTHRPDIDYFDYVRAVKQNPIARQVKLFDLLHNSDQTRCAFLPAKKRAQLKEKYDRALAILRQP